jgi:uncharacterized membrane protein YciS (DUF1049 family)
MEQFNFGSFILGWACSYLIIATFYLYEAEAHRKRSQKLDREMEALINNAKTLQKYSRPVA